MIHLVVVERDVEISGKTRLSVLRSGSGGGRESHYCAECGTNLWCRYLYHRVAVIAVRAGTLDDPPRLARRPTFLYEVNCHG